MGMKNSFTNAATNILTRNFGGTTVGVAEPYLTGTHFVWFDKIPADLISTISDLNGTSGLSTAGEVQSLLAGACYSVTPPGGTLNKVEFTGLGGIKFSVPGNIDYGNTVSVKFLEFSGTPILDIFHGWVQMIRDYRTGTSSLEAGAERSGYRKNKYACVMFYWTTAPDGKTVEYYACYDGVFPSKDPQDLFSSDVETVGRLDVEIEFNVDYIWHEGWVKDKCQSLADSFASGGGGRATWENIQTMGEAYK